MSCVLALLTGCASRPPIEGPLASLQTLQGHTLSPNHQQLGGRFGLKASFLNEPIQGRFDWRKPRNGVGPELLELQNPWGEVQAGLGRIRGLTGEPSVKPIDKSLTAKPTDFLGWQVFDHQGRPMGEAFLDRRASSLGLNAKTMAVFFQLLQALEPQLASLPNPKPISKRLSTPEGWIELRLIADPCCN